MSESTTFDESKQSTLANDVQEIEKETGELDPEPKDMKCARLGREKSHDFAIRGIAVGVVALMMIIAVTNREAFMAGVAAIRTVVTDYCSWFIILLTFCTFALCIYYAFSKYGKVRLGGKDAKPAFTYFSWMAMLFATGQGVGLVFWAVAEPIDMLAAGSGYPFAMQAHDVWAGANGLAWTYFHWGIPAWPIYALMSLFMAYSRYNMHKDNTYRGAVENLFPKSVRVPVGIVIEAIVVLVTIFGLTTSLGLASFQFETGLAHIIPGVEPNTQLIAGIVIFFGLIATLDVWFGIVKGIKKVSNMNAILSFVLVGSCLVLGPTLYILGSFNESMGVYIDQFFLMSGYSEAYNLSFAPDYLSTWNTWWSFFIFSWCFAFGSFTAGFISTISRGRTLKEFLLGICGVGGGVCIVWTCVVGGTGVRAALIDPTIVEAVTADSSSGLFYALQSVMPGTPIPFILTVVATVLIGGYIVTTVDSGVVAMSSFMSPKAKESRAFKAILSLCVVALASFFLITCGQEVLSTIQFTVIAAGVPMGVIVILMFVQFKNTIKHDPQLVELGLAEPFPEGSEWDLYLKEYEAGQAARMEGFYELVESGDADAIYQQV